MKRSHRSEALIVASVVAVVFGPMALRCGLYEDDFWLWSALSGGTYKGLWDAGLHFIPGRNLFVLLFAGCLRFTHGSVVALHGITLAWDAMNAALAYFLILELSGFVSIALPAALVFAVFPNHGETHFWIASSLQYLASATAALLAGLIAARPGPLHRRIMAVLGFYTAGCLINEQMLFLWPLILAFVWKRTVDDRKQSSSLAAGAIYAGLFDVSYVMYRHWTSTTYKDRPVIHLGHAFPRFAEGVYTAVKGIFWPLYPAKLPHAGWTFAIALLVLSTAGFLVRRHREWLDDERAALSRYAETSGPLWLCVFGAAWFILSYVPNFFWYLSPRHNYLPSFGWILFCAGVMVWSVRRGRRWIRVVPAFMAIIFANDVVADVREGSVWVYAGRLHQAYLQEAARFYPDPGNLFLVGAPYWVEQSPAFPIHHFDDLNAWGAGRKAFAGDIAMTPTRRGVLFDNNLQRSGRGAFKWLPYGQVHAIRFDPEEGFRCLRTIQLTMPDGSILDALLPPSPGCVARLDLEMETVLISAKEVSNPASSKHRAGTSAGIELVSTRLVASSDRLRLTLEWVAKAPMDGMLVVVPTLHSMEGRVLYDSAYPDPGRKTTQRLWPLVDDEFPVSRWRPGHAVREIYEMRAGRELPPGPCHLKLDAYLLKPLEPPHPIDVLELDVVAQKG